MVTMRSLYMAMGLAFAAVPWGASAAGHGADVLPALADPNPILVEVSGAPEVIVAFHPDGFLVDLAASDTDRVYGAIHDMISSDSIDDPDLAIMFVSNWMRAAEMMDAMELAEIATDLRDPARMTEPFFVASHDFGADGSVFFLLIAEDFFDQPIPSICYARFATAYFYAGTLGNGFDIEACSVIRG